MCRKLLISNNCFLFAFNDLSAVSCTNEKHTTLFTFKWNFRISYSYWYLPNFVHTFHFHQVNRNWSWSFINARKWCVFSGICLPYNSSFINLTLKLKVIFDRFDIVFEIKFCETVLTKCQLNYQFFYNETHWIRWVEEFVNDFLPISGFSWLQRNYTWLCHAKLN